MKRKISNIYRRKTISLKKKRTKNKTQRRKNKTLLLEIFKLLLSLKINIKFETILTLKVRFENNQMNIKHSPRKNFI